MDKNVGKPVITQIPVPEDTFYDRITAVKACTVMLAFLGCSVELCYEALRPATVKVTALFKTPLGDVEMGSATLTPESASIELEGKIEEYGATLKVEVDFETGILKACGEVSVPPLSKKGCFEHQF